ncbi:hypothetical protein QJQ45_027262 [Haematococcus lacustris]|nr:hypothetical protein QJQ45_027262 [Haematococcus lacustris]
MAWQLGGHGRALWRGYEAQLTKRPVAVQALTSAALWGLGDLVAQRYAEQRKHVDQRRLGLTAAFGAGFMGPVGHFWYLGLDVAARKLLSPGTARYVGAKVLADTLILGPIYVLAFYAWGSFVIDGSGWSTLKDKVTKDFIPTYLAELAIWPAFQTVNFIRVPVAHQLLAVNVMTILDASFLSFARSQSDWVATVAQALNLRAKPAWPAEEHPGRPSLTVQPSQAPDAPPFPPLPPRAPAQPAPAQPAPAQPASTELDCDSDSESDCDSEPESQSDSEPHPNLAHSPPQLGSARLAALDSPPLPLDSVMLRQLKDFSQFFANPNFLTFYNQLRRRLSSELQAANLDKTHVADLIEEADKHRRLLGMKKQGSLQHLAAASSAGTSLEANLKHITVTLATWDAVWEVYLDPNGHKSGCDCTEPRTEEQFFKKTGSPPAGQVDLRLLRPAWSQQRDLPVRGLMWCPIVAPRKPPQAPRSSQAATLAAASQPGPSTPPPAKRNKRTEAEQAAEPSQSTKG